MKLKFKKGVTGLAWNYEHGELVTFFKSKLTVREKQLMQRVCGEDVCLIFDEEDIDDILCIGLEDDESIQNYGLGRVLQAVV
jgi:hypothetical protein